MEVLVDEGILAGTEVGFSMVDMPDNETSALIGIDWLKENKVVIDDELSKTRFKEDPARQWHCLLTTDLGLMIILVTREAVERYATLEEHGQYVDSQHIDVDNVEEFRSDPRERVKQVSDNKPATVDTSDE